MIIEAKAASKALQFAANLGFNQVIPEGDCQVLMKALKEDRIFLSTDGLFIDDVRFVARLFNQLRYSHVKREGNTVVHSLAQYAFRNFGFCCVDRGCSTTFDFLLSKLTFLVFINKKYEVCPTKKNLTQSVINKVSFYQIRYLKI